MKTLFLVLLELLTISQASGSETPDDLTALLNSLLSSFSTASGQGICQFLADPNNLQSFEGKTVNAACVVNGVTQICNGLLISASGSSVNIDGIKCIDPADGLDKVNSGVTKSLFNLKTLLSSLIQIATSLASTASGGAALISSVRDPTSGGNVSVDAFAAVVNQLGSVLGGVGNPTKLLGLVSNVTNTLSGLTNHFGGFLDTVAALLDPVSSLLGPVSGILSTLTTTLGGLLSTLGAILDGLTGTVSGLITTASGLVSSATDLTSLIDILTGTLSGLHDTLTGLGGGVAGLDSPVAALGEAFSTATSLTSTLKDPLNELFGVISGMAGTFTSALIKNKGVSSPTPGV